MTKGLCIGAIGLANIRMYACMYIYTYIAIQYVASYLPLNTFCASASSIQNTALCTNCACIKQTNDCKYK